MTEIQEVSYDNYKIWKRNSLVLYDLCISHVLSYPTLTLDFQPVAKTSKFKVDDQLISQSLITFAIGTNTPQETQRDQNFIFVKQLILPSIYTVQDKDSVTNSENGLLVGGYNMITERESFGRLVDQYTIKFTTECNQLAFCPVEPDILSALTDDGLTVYNTQTLLLKQKNENSPIMQFDDVDGGFGLACSQQFLAHGGNQQISIYDLQNKQLIYQQKIDSVVNAVEFSPFYNDIVALATDDGELIFIDYIQKTDEYRVLLGNLAEGFVPTSLSFSRHHENVIAVGSSDGQLMIFDIQQKKIIQIIRPHDKAIFQIRFSPFYEQILLSGSEDCKINMYMVSDKQIKTIFIHSGHTMPITDVKFHPLVPNLIGSCAEDNSLQFWWPSEQAFK